VVQKWNLTEKPIKVLIVSTYRSGSSFIGELFNQNSKSFYLFEPLGGVSDTSEYVFHLIRHYNCDMPNYYYKRRTGFGDFVSNIV